jgi:hypothetical protein
MNTHTHIAASGTKTSIRLALAARYALPVTASCAIAGLLLTGCGGGGIDDVVRSTTTSRQSVAAANVQLEGCVVDSKYMGVSGAAVHVRTSNGRVVGTALTNADGVYVVTVPARSSILVDTTVGGAGGLSLNTGSGSLSVTGCLLADI